MFTLAQIGVKDQNRKTLQTTEKYLLRLSRNHRRMCSVRDKYRDEQDYDNLNGKLFFLYSRQLFLSFCLHFYFSYVFVLARKYAFKFNHKKYFSWVLYRMLTISVRQHLKPSLFLGSLPRRRSQGFVTRSCPTGKFHFCKIL